MKDSSIDVCLDTVSFIIFLCCSEYPSFYRRVVTSFRGEFLEYLLLQGFLCSSFLLLMVAVVLLTCLASLLLVCNVRDNASSIREARTL